MTNQTPTSKTTWKLPLSDNDRITIGCDIVNLMGPDEYERLCRKFNVSRIFNVKRGSEAEAELVKYWEENVAFTRTRMKELFDYLAEWATEKDKHIDVSYTFGVNRRDTFQLGGIMFGRKDYVSVLTKLRNLGVTGLDKYYPYKQTP